MNDLVLWWSKGEGKIEYILPCWAVGAGTRLVESMSDRGYSLTNCTSHTHHPVEGGRAYVYGSKYTFRNA
jgi:hypothetical protein